MGIIIIIFIRNNLNYFFGLFYDCDNIINIDLSSFNTKNVTNMSSMFDNCENLTNINLSSFDTKNITEMNFMFDCCLKLKNSSINYNKNDSKIFNQLKYAYILE